MGWDPRSAGNYAKAQAEPGPTSNCAAYVRQAIHAGGINVINTHHAKDYGPMLEAAGFRKISSTQSPMAGDVVVIPPYTGGSASGHMAIYDGQDWYSDFKQRDFWGGPGYRSSKPSYQMYRMN
ncbi:CHAP domain-containing protein [Citrobacter portucalensis]|uniref:CHAP domain-containing protein n=1 Tax=Citrobacter portucalensis TaxID=1639133 RepID=UPI00226B2250|nr:CHAP domain-containing protein [Citrobacter portucalensis]MCX8983828.1 CHAP domain-containing protein [Citrobacter portucalensis]